LLVEEITSNSPMVMVVDDADEYRCVLRAWLQMRGYAVIEASDGDEASVNATKNHPDLILMDIAMPHRSGISAAYRIRNNPALRDIPIIAITGFVADDLRDEAVKAGCLECLTKPLDLHYLENLLQRLLRSRSPMRRRKEAEVSDEV
jgi:CheY-like chemotaxis protein